MTLLTRTFMLLLGFFGAVYSHQFTSCAGQDLLGIKQVGLSPDPPQAGQDLTVSISGVSVTDISDATLELQVDALGIKIADMSFDMCKDLHVSCPLKKGQTYQASIKYQIPAEAPKGIDVSAQLVGRDSSGSEIGCVKLSTHVSQEQDSSSHLGATALTPSTNDIQYLFEAWKNQYKHHFTSPSHYVKAFDTFSRHTEKIQQHNQKTSSSYKLSHNQYSYIPNEEFRKIFTPRRFKIKSSTGPVTHQSTSVPESVDWRDRGAVTPVKNQQQCGSCWAFSTTGAVEGAYYLKNGNLTSFSEQELVSCDKVDQGCNGGEMDDAFQWIQKQGGLCSESDYPYHSGTGNSGSCAKKCQPVKGSQVKSYVDVNATESELKAAVAKQPVAIAIEADGFGFQLYHSGVYTGKCGTNLDHGVLLVGYGTDNGQDYWLVKNSWGDSWGDSGYIKIERGKSQEGGQCGILLSASYPVL